MIRTGIADIRPLYDDSVYNAYYNAAPDFRKQKARRLKSQRQKAQSIGAWILYEQLRGLYGISEEAAFNLSHSGDYALCSIEDNPKRTVKVGCDLEEIKKLHTKLIDRYFLPNEREYILQKLTEEERKEAFYRYWVLKESYMKATGYGMRLGLSAFEIGCADKTSRLVKKPDGLEEDYYFKEYDAGIPYKIAVCSTSRSFDEEIQRIKL